MQQQLMYNMQLALFFQVAISTFITEEISNHVQSCNLHYMGHMERQRLNSNLSRSMYGDRVYFLLAHFKGSDN